MKINNIVNEIYECAKSHGWWDKPRTPLEIHMLVVSELAEATEAIRNSEPSLHFGKIVEEGPNSETNFYLLPTVNHKKPEGEAVELADAVIRIMDYFGKQGWDLEEVIRLKHEYNITRPYRHGGKTA